MIKRYWRTKDGERLLISKMTTSHIKNCLRMINNYQERRIIAIGEQGTYLHGEEASYMFDHMYDYLLENGFDENDTTQQFIFSFENELLKRGEPLLGDEEER